MYHIPGITYEKNQSGNEYFQIKQEWRNELIVLRKIILSTELEEKIKWGAPVYTIRGKNVIGIGAFKSWFELWFFPGGLLKDPNDKLISAVIADLPPSLKKDFGGFSKTTFDSINSLQKLEFNSVGQDGMSEILKVLNGQVAVGASRTQAIKTLKKTLNRNIVRYSETYVETAKNMFNQEVNNKIAKDVGFDGIWEYIGAPLQANSHLECIWALTKKPKAPYFTTAEKIKFEKILDKIS